MPDSVVGSHLYWNCDIEEFMNSSRKLSYSGLKSIAVLRAVSLKNPWRAVHGTNWQEILGYSGRLYSSLKHRSASTDDEP
jgi:hypothetical protein